MEQNQNAPAGLIGAQTTLGYARANLMMPGEVFVREWGTLTDTDKEDIKRWAAEEMAVLGIPVK